MYIYIYIQRERYREREICIHDSITHIEARAAWAGQPLRPTAVFVLTIFELKIFVFRCSNLRFSYFQFSYLRFQGEKQYSSSPKWIFVLMMFVLVIFEPMIFVLKFGRKTCQNRTKTFHFRWAASASDRAFCYSLCFVWLLFVLLLLLLIVLSLS